MKDKFFAFCGVCAFGLIAAAEDYNINVDDGWRAITADEVSALAGKNLVKTGAGTLEVGDELASFTGAIYIYGGVYRATTSNALGTGDGMTYIDGGSLDLSGSLNAGVWSGTYCFPAEEIHVRGTGANNAGAICSRNWDSQSIAKAVVLDGDARITSGNYGCISLNKVNIGKWTLTAAVGNGGVGYIVGTVTSQGGNIVLESGDWRLNSWPNTGSGSVTIGSSTTARMYSINTGLVIPSSFVLKDGCVFKIEGATLPGNFTIEGAATVEVPEGFTTTLDGTISETGSGGFIKTGAGTLVIGSASALAKPVDVREGTVKWGRALGEGDYYHGLNSWYIDNKQCQWCSDSGAVHGEAVSTGVKTGISSAYGEVWRDSSAYANGAVEHGKWYFYKGYVRVPGEPGTKTKLNAIGCLKRYVSIRIGDTKIIELDNNAEKVSGLSNLDYTYMAAGPAFEIDAGWQPIWVSVGAYYGAACGPWDNWGRWENDFGVGVNWSGSCTSNRTDYVKLIDGQNGIMLATSTNLVPFAEAGNRAQFAGGVTFAPGTAFDVGDVAPYATAAEVPSLTGVTAIRNGIVKVAAWNLRASDLTSGTPLSVAAGSTLAFTNGAVLSLGDLRGVEFPYEGITVASAADGASISGAPALSSESAAFYKLAVSEDGKTLTLSKRLFGTTVIVK